MNRLFGISYAFSEMPDIDTISKEGSVAYSPLVVCCEGRAKEFSRLQFPQAFRSYPRDIELSPGHRSYYKGLHTTARDHQERLVADYICAFILEKLRTYPKDHCTFVIKDTFESEKFVGRLGYLGLPLDRLTIYFVSRDLKDMLTNYISPFSAERRSDLSILQKERKKILGPYPADEEITMLYTFYCAFEKQELYPIRINLFAQFMDRSTLERRRAGMERYFLAPGTTEVCPVDGGRKLDRTRMPTVLLRCEDYIRQRKDGGK